MFIAERWIDSFFDVVRVNDQIMYVRLVIGRQILNIVSAYAPRVGLSADEEKNDFWDIFIIVLSVIPKQEDCCLVKVISHEVCPIASNGYW